MYVDNKKFLEAIREHKRKVNEAKENGTETPRISEYIGECLYKIAENYFLKPRFNRYSYREDMISEAVMTCIKYFDSFDPDRSNPFAYFTSVVKHSFLQVVNSEERSRYKMLKNFTENMLIGNESQFISENLITNEDIYDNMYDFMESYEQREKIKKEKRKEKTALSKYLETTKKQTS